MKKATRPFRTSWHQSTGNRHVPVDRISTRIVLQQNPRVHAAVLFLLFIQKQNSRIAARSI